MSDLLSKHLRHADPLGRGFTREGIINGMTLSRGFAFGRVSGGFNLYRGANYATLELVGAAVRGATSIEPAAWIGQPAGRYVFVCRAIGPGGVEAVDPQAAPPAAVVIVNAAGTALSAAPAAPKRLRASAVAGGAIRLQWEHLPARGTAAVANWRIYGDAGTGTIDYGTVLGSVRARVGLGGAGIYVWTSEAFADGSVRKFVVRARTAGGVEETNTLAVSATAVAAASADHAVTAASYGADE